MPKTPQAPKLEHTIIVKIERGDEVFNRPVLSGEELTGELRVIVRTAVMRSFYTDLDRTLLYADILEKWTCEIRWMAGSVMTRRHLFAGLFGHELEYIGARHLPEGPVDHMLRETHYEIWEHPGVILIPKAPCHVNKGYVRVVTGKICCAGKFALTGGGFQPEPWERGPVERQFAGHA